MKKLKAVGVDRLLLLDVHSSAVENAAWALDIKCDHLWAKPIFIKYLQRYEYLQLFMGEGFVVAGPDLNAGKFARGYGEIFGVPIALIEKRRDVSTGKTAVLNVIGDVSGKNVLLVDDMIDTAGTTSDAADVFKNEGAKEIWALATHGVFSGKAYENIGRSCIKRILVTDSIHRKPSYTVNGEDVIYVKDERERANRGYIGIETVSVSSLLGEAIFRIHSNQSVSSLFEN